MLHPGKLWCSSHAVKVIHPCVHSCLSVCLSVCLQSANSFHPQTVLNQLKYSGMMETVRIRRAGYPVRRTFEDFLHRYHIFARTQAGGGEPKGRCTRLVQMYDPEGVNWQMGLTKVGATLSSPSPPLSLPLPSPQSSPSRPPGVHA